MNIEAHKALIDNYLRLKNEINNLYKSIVNFCKYVNFKDCYIKKGKGTFFKNRLKFSNVKNEEYNLPYLDYSFIRTKKGFYFNDKAIVLLNNIANENDIIVFVDAVNDKNDLFFTGLNGIVASTAYKYNFSLVAAQYSLPFICFFLNEKINKRCICYPTLNETDHLKISKLEQLLIPLLDKSNSQNFDSLYQEFLESKFNLYLSIQTLNSKKLNL